MGVDTIEFERIIEDPLEEGKERSWNREEVAEELGRKGS